MPPHSFFTLRWRCSNWTKSESSPPAAMPPEGSSACQKRRETLQDGRQVYDWPAYAKKFGYVTCEPIQNQEACANYVVEYITKELEEHVSVLNKKLYLCSQGLNRSQVVLRGHIIRSFVPDFFNEYVAIKKFPSRREALSLFDREDMPGQPLVGFYDIVGPLQKEGPLQKGGASAWTG